MIGQVAAGGRVPAATHASVPEVGGAPSNDSIRSPGSGVAPRAAKNSAREANADGSGSHPMAGRKQWERLAEGKKQTASTLMQLAAGRKWGQRKSRRHQRRRISSKSRAPSPPFFH